LKGPEVSGTPALITCFFMVVPFENELRLKSAAPAVSHHGGARLSMRGAWLLLPTMQDCTGDKRLTPSLVGMADKGGDLAARAQ
jgi:hypothetical protein